MPYVWYTPEFLAWYKAYPKPVAKADAQKAFGRLSKRDLLLLIDNSRAWFKEFTRRDSDYIPYPASFIRDRTWEELPPAHVDPRTGQGKRDEQDLLGAITGEERP